MRHGLVHEILGRIAERKKKFKIQEFKIQKLYSIKLRNIES